MDTSELLQRFGIAVALGLLIGIERGWKERARAAGARVAGIRTYTLIALLGAMWAALSPDVGAGPLVVGALVVGGGLTWFHWRSQEAQGKVSVTGVVVGLIAYALGAYTLLGDRLAAIAIGVAVVVLLVSREYLHGLLRKITWPEMRSAVILLAMTFLALPVLPDKTVDPWGALNPHDVWLMTVLMAAISYAGYIVVRLETGSSALIHGAMAGSLVSSTMVTLVNARLAAKARTNNTAAATAVALGWAVSLARMTVVVAVVNLALLPKLAAPMAAAVAVLALAAYLLHRAGGAGAAAKVEFGNPFDLPPLLGAGALLAAIMMAVKLLNDAFGQSGVLPLAAISGFTDVDPITISVARMTALDAKVAVQAILLAAGANMITKIGISFVIGGMRFGLPLAGAGAGAILAAGGVALAL
ncbi:MAG: DUF4010 domain-containing protein [Rhodospirillaceae bacterium]|nr:DUF4010 domain-containing protein [Rhodospirillaceae bacterium]